MAQQHHGINYIELPMTDTLATKTFYHDVFGWKFTDWAPTYVSFSGAGIDGGFNGEGNAPVTAPGVLVVLYSSTLENTRDAIRKAGGSITQEIYDFPGGRRFHFTDPNGNELAVWSE